jgi:hypothetical protein
MFHDENRQMAVELKQRKVAVAVVVEVAVVTMVVLLRMMKNLMVEMETVAPVEVLVHRRSHRQVVEVSLEKRWTVERFVGAVTET